MLVKKTDMVREAVVAGQWKKALSIAKGFKMGLTKEQSDAMIRGFECMTNPRFYMSLGMDIDSIVAKGVETVQQLYGQP